MSIDPKFVELTADVVRIILSNPHKYAYERSPHLGDGRQRHPLDSMPSPLHALRVLELPQEDRLCARQPPRCSGRATQRFGCSVHDPRPVAPGTSWQHAGERREGNGRILKVTSTIGGQYAVTGNVTSTWQYMQMRNT